MISLFEPYSINSTIKLKNRFVMAPMTRRQALANHVPNAEIMGPYYSRRADTGLIVTEGTLISADAIGYGNVPGIYNDEQITAWQHITDQVHQNGGLIFLQLWHNGRISHSNFHQGRLPLAPSAIAANVALGGSGFDAEKPREASIEDIQQLLNDYAQAAQNAMLANFDGVEIHGGNGYLIDQFLHACSNQRTDEYGNSASNRARFCLEIVNVCGNAVGFERVGLRLSPGGHMNDIITEPQDKQTFIYLLQQLNVTSLAYVHTANFDDTMIYAELENKTMTEFMRPYFNGTLIAAGNYNFKTAQEKINAKQFDLVAMGKPFIANPNLITMLRNTEQPTLFQKEMLNQLY